MPIDGPQIIDRINCTRCDTYRSMRVTKRKVHSGYDPRTSIFTHRFEFEHYCEVCCHNFVVQDKTLKTPRIKPLPRLLRSRTWATLEK